jgi:ornithine carbamoyltransferase
MGQEKEQVQRLHTLSTYQLNESIVAVAKPDTIVLHCLPAHRGEEITEAVIDGPQSAVLEQAENRLHVQKAILTEWIGRPCS